MTPIAALIVNYGTADLTIKAVESLLASDFPEHDFEIHVVDNASPNGDADRLTEAARGWGDRVTLYLEQTNHGFGRGNNLVLAALAARDTPPEKVILLNPDAQAQPDTVQVLSAFLDSHPQAAVAGCKILDPDTKTPVTSAFRFPTALNEFVGSIQFGPVSRLFPTAHIPMPPDLPTMQVDWIAGAAFVARFKILQDAGFFDDRFFLYYEEVDLMRQIRNAGWEIWYTAETAVEHFAGASTGLHGEKKTERRALPAYWYESWRIYISKNHSRFYALACAASKLAGWCLNSAICRIRRKPPAAPKRFLADFWHLALQPMIFDTRSARHE